MIVLCRGGESVYQFDRYPLRDGCTHPLRRATGRQPRGPSALREAFADSQVLVECRIFRFQFCERSQNVGSIRHCHCAMTIVVTLRQSALRNAI